MELLLSKKPQASLATGPAAQPEKLSSAPPTLRRIPSGLRSLVSASRTLGSRAPFLQERKSSTKFTALADNEHGHATPKTELECHKVLVLGVEGSGAFRMVRQMKMTHKDGYSRDERLAFRPVIWKNVLQYATIVVLELERENLEPASEQNKINCELIREHTCRPDSSLVCLDPAIAKAAHELWSDEVISLLLKNPSQEDVEFVRIAGYLFKNAPRFSSQDYIPTDKDLYHAFISPNDIWETRLVMDDMVLRMYELGHLVLQDRTRPHTFKNLTSLVFCVCLTDYRTFDQNRNRLLETYDMFESVVNSGWFTPRTSIILILTKMDHLQEMLTRHPLEKLYPEDRGGAHARKAAKYIVAKFSLANRAGLPMYPLITSTTGTTALKHLHNAVQETVLQNLFKKSNFL